MYTQEGFIPYGEGKELGIPGVPTEQTNMAADVKQPDASERVRKQIIEKAWRDETFKKALMADPKKALEEEFHLFIPENINLKVVEETENQFYLVLPTEPDIDPDAVAMWI